MRVSRMSSSIFSFRTIAAAAAVVGLVEGVCALALRPGLVERANDGLLDPFHNSLIFGKLAAFGQSSPDIIQVGDSSGFHGVRPEVVMSYLDGLKLEASNAPHVPLDLTHAQLPHRTGVQTEITRRLFDGEHNLRVSSRKTNLGVRARLSILAAPIPGLKRQEAERPAPVGPL